MYERKKKLLLNEIIQKRNKVVKQKMKYDFLSLMKFNVQCCSHKNIKLESLKFFVGKLNHFLHDCAL